ncbi:MAG: single-stranded-DNA-specific exonuclease RecJ [Desulfobacterales bacterium]|nr:single-stranded-DNA-specific exonuclease RecJ [Desulfobacterales bacterium]MDD4073210.1 single-stranded-DNA-specific exonuclease RecJ [Desulfobacterales bacterium]MDD4392302.1 single-stranded-DNA-specific exonuclease RecJ [Desulfobacterales bacterium]
MKTKWRILEPDRQSTQKLCETLHFSPVTAAILANRHIMNEAHAWRYLNADLNHLRPPFPIKDINKATERIVKAILGREHILIFGDYDVDGVTSTAVLLDFFRHTGTDVSYYIPHRIHEGYGLQEQHIFNYALPHHIDLIITVDCGSSSHASVIAANRNGIDVIITDHHQIADDLPPALAVVNPKRSDCTAGFEHLAGVGVAFYLLICLRKKLRDINFWHTRPEPNLRQYMDLVALGTVADVVPLVKENRIMAKSGLDIIHSEHRCGIKALIECCRIGINSADCDDIGYKLAPRLNAAGRLDHATMAVELLTTLQAETARQIAHQLDRLNEKRQTTEKKVYQQILDHLDANPHLVKMHTLVLSDAHWHEGILGIVASRLANRFFRPTVLISTKSGIGKSSARSIPGVNLHQMLSLCASRLEQYGGHPMAAGLRIKPENIDLFAQDFERTVREMTCPEDFTREIIIDYDLDFEDISDTLMNELERLKPFGEGNPEPLFMATHIDVLSSRIVGGKHLKIMLKKAGNSESKPFNTIYFNADISRPFPDHLDKIAFHLRWNQFKGQKSIQLVIEEALEP